MGNKTPCYECTERTSECHATCERYGAYNEKREQERNERAKEKYRESSFVERIQKTMKKNKKYLKSY